MTTNSSGRILVNFAKSALHFRNVKMNILVNKKNILNHFKKFKWYINFVIIITRLFEMDHRSIFKC